MKRSLVFVILLLSLFSLPLYAAEVEPEGTALRKLQRGFLNVVLSPIEISTELAKEKTKDTFPPSWMLGASRGAFFMFGRIVAGAVEMVTFPVSIPSGYAPILQPEFPYQHLDQASVII